MSIFASLAAPDDSDHADGCAVYAEMAPGYFEFSGNACDCGQPDAPLRYQGSHILPSATDRREGFVDIALIPSHITRDGRDDQPEDERPWPYLRFGVNEQTVILEPHHVRQIRDSLADWLTSLERVVVVTPGSSKAFMGRVIAEARGRVTVETLSGNVSAAFWADQVRDATPREIREAQVITDPADLPARVATTEAGLDRALRKLAAVNTETGATLTWGEAHALLYLIEDCRCHQGSAEAAAA